MDSGNMVLDTIINLGWGYRIFCLRHGLEELLCRLVNIEAFGTALELDNSSVSVKRKHADVSRTVTQAEFADVSGVTNEGLNHLNHS